MAARQPALGPLPPDLEPDPDSGAEPDSRDRLGFAAFLTGALHLAVLLGVGFTVADPPERAISLEVTLARHNDRQAPDKADFVADANQLASGDLSEVRDTTTTEMAPFNDDAIREVDQAQAPLPEPEPLPEARRPELAADAASTRTATSALAEDDPQERTRPPLPEEALALSQEIASLQARIDAERQLQARGPRVRRLTTQSTKSAEDAAYLEGWRRRVESLGNLNYPEEAKRNGLYGSLVLRVVVLPDGSLKGVHIVESSGQKVLDDAAVRIVRMAAPYAPFPEEMRGQVDQLEIIRTWQFRQNRYSSG